MTDLAEIISRNEDQIRSEWIRDMSRSVQRADLISKTELEEQCKALLNAIVAGVRSSAPTDVMSADWNAARELLVSISASRARQGFSPTEVATFVMSLKQPLFMTIRREMGKSPEKLFETIWQATELLDRLALVTTEAYTTMREELITRQQQELMELSTPVVKLWDGILALPIIGTLDSARTQVVMENLLQTVVATNSRFAIIDITGVPTVDTLVAQHLLKTITAARLMGAECIISGVRPQIAQTIVHLGINLEDVMTKANLADAFALALQMSGRTVVRKRLPQSAKQRHSAAERGELSGTHPGSFAWAVSLITIQVDMHDKLALQLQDDVTNRIAEWGTGSADRYFVAGDCGFVYRPHAGQHRGHVASTGRRDGGGGDAAGSSHHSGGAGDVAAGSTYRAECGSRHGAALRSGSGVPHGERR